MRVLLSVLGVGVLLVAVLGWALSAPNTIPESALVGLEGDAEAGRKVFLAGGCASCHMETGDDADPTVLAGGRSLQSDFGTFYSPNISPDPEHGIGGWTQAEFINASLRGVSPDGQHYYPAFPYPSYARADPQDFADLHAYIMTLPADPTESRPHDLGFPFTIRRGLGLWKQLYLRDDWVITGDLSEAEARGRYLAEALSHCGECHTPRNLIGGLDHDRWFEGAPNPSGRGRIPAIVGSGFTWTEFDISAYLESGLTPDFDVVGGSMAAVVDNLRQLDKADLDAIAAYVIRAGE